MGCVRKWHTIPPSPHYRPQPPTSTQSAKNLSQKDASEILQSGGGDSIPTVTVNNGPVVRGA
eukprot:4309526-Amphidinium_carterae.1